MRQTGAEIMGRAERASPLFAVLALWALFVATNPVGYVGGGHDDTHYLAAARCWAEHGPCLPIDHWWRRFPLVAPVSLTIALFGLSRQTVWIVPAVYSAVAVVLLTIIVQRQFGRAAGLLAGAAFVLTPVVAIRVIDLGIDLPEMALLLGAAACFQHAVLRKASTFFALSGIFLALAVQCRPTVLAAVPVFCMGLFLIDRRQCVPFLAGFIIPMLVEAALYQAIAADALLSWRLSLAHTTIPSSELSGVDLSSSPLFNVRFIQAWQPISGIHLNWFLQGPVNLLVSKEIGITLYFSLALIIINIKSIGLNIFSNGIAIFLVVASIFYFAALNYVFAIDPTPRMFLPVLAVACAIIGILTPVVWRGPGRIVIVLFFGAIVMRALLVPFQRYDVDSGIPLARQWLQEAPDTEIYPATYSRLAFVSEQRSFREYQGSEGGRILVLDFYSCPAFAVGAGHLQWRVLREVRFPGSPIKRVLERTGLTGSDNDPVLCLFASPASHRRDSHARA